MERTLPTLPQRLAAEAVGTGLLLATVVGSGIMGERLAAGNLAIALLANSLATGAGLLALILMLGPISGAHLNPVVTLVAALRGQLARRDVFPYLAAQVAGAVAGVLLAHLMFGEPPFTPSTHERSGPSQLLAEAAATFGLVATVFLVARHRAESTPLAVSAWIVAAYWFTSSTSFANPAVTLARSLTDTFAGIRPVDTAPFIAAQILGALSGLAFVTFLTAEKAAERAHPPHPRSDAAPGLATPSAPTSSGAP